MKAEHLARLEQQQTSIAKKVLAYVPSDQPVNSKQVATRMKAHLGLAPSFAVVEGCLGHMAHVGLLKEPDKGFFLRVASKTNGAAAPIAPPVRTDIASQFQAAADKKAEERVEPAKPTPEQGEDLLTKFSAITADMRLNGKELIDMANELDDFITSLSSQLDKLNQLKKMFKDMV